LIYTGDLGALVVSNRTAGVNTPQYAYRSVQQRLGWLVW
jgi:hypothetical protein